MRWSMWMCCRNSLKKAPEISPETLVSNGVLREIHDGLKILGNGEVSKKFTVKAHKISQSAQEKLIAAGGTVEILKAERK